MGGLIMRRTTEPELADIRVVFNWIARRRIVFCVIIITGILFHTYWHTRTPGLYRAGATLSLRPGDMPVDYFFSVATRCINEKSVKDNVLNSAGHPTDQIVAYDLVKFGDMFGLHVIAKSPQAATDFANKWAELSSKRISSETKELNEFKRKRAAEEIDKLRLNWQRAIDDLSNFELQNRNAGVRSSEIKVVSTMSLLDDKRRELDLASREARIISNAQSVAELLDTYIGQAYSSDIPRFTEYRAIVKMVELGHNNTDLLEKLKAIENDVVGLRKQLMLFVKAQLASLRRTIVYLTNELESIEAQARIEAATFTTHQRLQEKLYLAHRLYFNSLHGYNFVYGTAVPPVVAIAEPASMGAPFLFRSAPFSSKVLGVLLSFGLATLIVIGIEVVEKRVYTRQDLCEFSSVYEIKCTQKKYSRDDIEVLNTILELQDRGTLASYGKLLLIIQSRWGGEAIDLTREIARYYKDIQRDVAIIDCAVPDNGRIRTALTEFDERQKHNVTIACIGMPLIDPRAASLCERADVILYLIPAAKITKSQLDDDLALFGIGNIPKIKMVLVSEC